MSGNEIRLQAINEVTNRGEVPTGPTPGPLSEIWACDVFNLATMEEALSKNAFKAMKKTVQTGAPLDPVDGRCRRRGHEGLGALEGGEVLLPHLLPDDEHHCGKARWLHRDQRRRQRDHRVHRQPSHQRRARRLLVPEWQSSHDRRRAGLHGLGPDEPGLRDEHARTARP